MDYIRLGTELEDREETGDFCWDEDAGAMAVDEVLSYCDDYLSPGLSKRNMERTERFYKAFSMLKQINLGQFDIIRRSFPSSPPGNAGLVIEASRIVFRGSDIKVFNAVRKLADSVAIGVSETNKARIQFWFN